MVWCGGKGGEFVGKAPSWGVLGRKERRMRWVRLGWRDVRLEVRYFGP